MTTNELPVSLVTSAISKMAHENWSTASSRAGNPDLNSISPTLNPGTTDDLETTVEQQELSDETSTGRSSLPSLAPDTSANNSQDLSATPEFKSSTISIAELTSQNISLSGGVTTQATLPFSSVSHGGISHQTNANVTPTSSATIKSSNSEVKTITGGTTLSTAIYINSDSVDLNITEDNPPYVGITGEMSTSSAAEASPAISARSTTAGYQQGLFIESLSDAVPLIVVCATTLFVFCAVMIVICILCCRSVTVHVSDCDYIL